MHFASLSKAALNGFHRNGQVLQRSNPRGCHLIDALLYMFFLSLFCDLGYIYTYIHVDHYANGFFWNLHSALLCNA